MGARKINTEILQELLIASRISLQQGAIEFKIDFEALQQEMSIIVRSKELRDQFLWRMSDLWFEYLHSKGERFRHAPLLRALFNHASAEYALSKGNLELATKFAVESNYVLEAPVLPGKRLINSSPGGIAHSKKYLPIRAEIISQLQQPPDGGWGRRKQTSIELWKRLSSFFLQYPFVKEPDKSIYNWLGDSPNIKSAYQKNRRNKN